MALGWSTTGRASVEGPLAGAAVAFALAMPGVARWFEPGAVAARGVSIGPFVAAVAGLELVLGALVLVTASFGRLFAEVGLATDWRTDLLVGLSRLVLDAGLLLAPPLLLAAVPLLRVGRRRARAATGVVLLATAFALAHTVGVPLLTCVTASWPGKL